MILLHGSSPNRKMGILCLCIVLLTTCDMSSVGAIGLFHHLKNKKSCFKKKPPIEIQESVVVRAFPWKPVEVKLTSQNKNLVGVLRDYDTLGGLISIINAKIIDTQETTPNTIRIENPDLILLKRGNRILVFPRLLFIAHPLFRTLPTRDKDLIATIKSVSPSVVPKGNDILQKLLPSGAMEDVSHYPNKAEIDFFGDYSRDDNNQQIKHLRLVVEKENVLSKTEKLQFKRNIFGKLYGLGKPDIESEYKKEAAGKLNTTPIFVLHRKLRGYQFFYISPFKNSGKFSVEGEALTELSKHKVGTVDKKALWGKYFSNSAISAYLVPGDRIEMTELSSFLARNRYLFPFP